MIDPSKALDRGMKATLFALFVALLLVGCAEYTTVDLDNPAIQKEMIMTAKLGDAIAQYNLGLMYEQGKSPRLQGSQTSRRPSREMPMLSVTGYMYDQGFGVPKDYKEAVSGTESLEQGLADAQCNLGYMYDQGFGVPKNYEAFKWYTKAAEHRQHDVLQRRRVPKDYKLAVKCFTKAAEQGLADAQSMVGVCYADGLGVAKNPIEGSVVQHSLPDEDAKEWKEIEEPQLIEESLSCRI